MRLVLETVPLTSLLRKFRDISLKTSTNSLTKRQKPLEFRYLVKRSVTLTSLETNIIVVTTT